MPSLRPSRNHDLSGFPSYDPSSTTRPTGSLNLEPSSQPSSGPIWLIMPSFEPSLSFVDTPKIEMTIPSFLSILPGSSRRLVGNFDVSNSALVVLRETIREVASSGLTGFQRVVEVRILNVVDISDLFLVDYELVLEEICQGSCDAQIYDSEMYDMVTSQMLEQFSSGEFTLTLQEKSSVCAGDCAGLENANVDGLVFRDSITVVVTLSPSGQPSVQTSSSPSTRPSSIPSTAPTAPPTSSPSKSPSKRPTLNPVLPPTPKPTPKPTAPKPTFKPTPRPTPKPTVPKPTFKPTPKPTSKPSFNPISKPTTNPTPEPTRKPTKRGKSMKSGKGKKSGKVTSEPTPMPVNNSTPRPTKRAKKKKSKMSKKAKKEINISLEQTSDSLRSTSDEHLIDVELLRKRIPQVTLEQSEDEMEGSVIPSFLGQYPSDRPIPSTPGVLEEELNPARIRIREYTSDATSELYTKHPLMTHQQEMEYQPLRKRGTLFFEDPSQNTKNSLGREKSSLLTSPDIPADIPTFLMKYAFDRKRMRERTSAKSHHPFTKLPFDNDYRPLRKRIPIMEENLIKTQGIGQTEQDETFMERTRIRVEASDTSAVLSTSDGSGINYQPLRKRAQQPKESQLETNEMFQTDNDKPPRRLSHIYSPTFYPTADSGNILKPSGV